jgi:hypothetical protein
MVTDDIVVYTVQIYLRVCVGRAANFAIGSEPLPLRAGFIVCRKEGTRFPSLNTGRFGVYSMNKTRGRTVGGKWL